VAVGGNGDGAAARVGEGETAIGRAGVAATGAAAGVGFAPQPATASAAPAVEAASKRERNIRRLIEYGMAVSFSLQDLRTSCSQGVCDPRLAACDDMCRPTTPVADRLEAVPKLSLMPMVRDPHLAA